MYRKINLGNYLPPITKETKEFEQIVIGENPEFNLLTTFSLTSKPFSPTPT